MFLRSLSLVIALTLSSPALFADETQTAQTPPAESVDIAKISEAFGHLIGKNIENLGIQFDMQYLVKGLQDSASGKAAPMTEGECVEAISAVQEADFKKQAAENLKVAEEFLTKNETQKGVVSLEEGKLQYKIEKKGKGAALDSHASPVIRYVGKKLDGTVFGASKEDEIIALDETIPGLSQGLIGMKEGEKRTLYIHPELGYGTKGYLPPNSLLTFEVELVKAHAPQNAENESISTTAHSKGKVTSEIASPVENSEVLR